jgi:hypothetical protein
MRDCFELVDISAYMFGCGLLLPVVNLIGRDSPMATVFLLALVIPIPLYVARFRFHFPNSIDSWLERYAYVLLFVGLGFLVMTLLAGIYRWAFVA